jgi:outer membrane protein assembly factor BamB
VGNQHRSVADGSSAVCITALLALLMFIIPAATAAAGPPRLVWQLTARARGIPAGDNVSAYFLTHDHELVAVSRTSGRIRWRLPMDSTTTTFGSRVIVRGDIVVAGDYDLAGVDRRTGRRQWEFVASDGGGSGMHLGEAAEEVVFSGSLAGHLHAIAIETGRRRWSVLVGETSSTTVYSPVVDNGDVAATFTVFGEQPTGGVVVVDAGTGRVRWRREVPASTGASGNPVLAGGVVIVAARDGRIHAFDRRSGHAKWTLPGVESLVGEQDYRPLAVSNHTLVAGSLSGEVTAWDLRTGRVRWRQTPSVASVAFGIAIHDEVVYVPLFANQLVALSLREGRELWRIGGGPSQFRWLPWVSGPTLLATGSEVLSLFRLDRTGFHGR